MSTQFAKRLLRAGVSPGDTARIEAACDRVQASADARLRLTQAAASGTVDRSGLAALCSAVPYLFTNVPAVIDVARRGRMTFGDLLQWIRDVDDPRA